MRIVAIGLMLGLAALPTASVAADSPPPGSRYFSGCGCKGGPGYRKADGACANRADMSSGVCGAPPAYARCKHENARPPSGTPVPEVARAGTFAL